MPRGQYAVQPGIDVEASKQTGRDNSYRACLHAMLIFIAICIILLVCAWPWNNHRVPSRDKDSNMSEPSSAAVKGDENPGTTYESFETRRTTPISTSTSTRKSTRTSTSRSTRYPTRVTRTTTEAVERKPFYTVIPDHPSAETTTVEDKPVVATTVEDKPVVATTVEDKPVDTAAVEDIPAVATTVEDQSTQATTVEDKPVVATTVEDQSTEATTVEERPQTTTFAVARKPLYTVIAEEEAASTTEPGAPPPTTTPVPEHETTPAVTEITTQGGGSLDEVEVFSLAGEGNTHTQEHYESSTPTTVPGDEAAPTEQVARATTVSDDVRSAETTPLSDVTEVPDEATSDTSARSVNPVCESSQCKALATRMLTLMNHSVDPCDDFYEYACGGLRFNPTLLGDDPSKDVYDRIRRGMESIVDDNSCAAHRKFKKFYKSCVEFDAVSNDLRITEVRRILETVGEFNEVDQEDPVVESFTSLISKLMLYHSTPLFDVILDVDGHNPSHFALKLTAPVFKPAFRPHDKREDCLKASLIGDLNNYYAEYTKCKKEEHIIYLQELDDALVALNIQRSTITDIRQNMEWNLLSAMEDLPAPGEMQQQLTGKEYELRTIRELDNLFPKVEWGTLVQTLLKRTLPDQTNVQVYFPHYLSKMFHKFHELKPRQQQNVLLAWLAHDLYVDLVLTRDSCSRDSYCLRVASDLMEDVSSSLYLSTFKQATLRSLRTEAQEVFKQLRSTFEVQLRDAKWLDDSSRSVAVSKLKSLTLEVDGGVSVFLNETFLDDRMTPIELQDTNYITLSASLLQRYRQMMYSLYDVSPSESKALWSHFLLPYSTQGIVIYALKKVVIPYGLMQKPMYEPSLPRYLLMARLGFVIAHEMAHHFDVTGMSYGPNGKGDEVLSHESSPAFGEMTSCPKDHHSFQGYHTADDGRSIKFQANESLSLNERLADRTAALLSYETYQFWVRNFEPQQLPYLGLTNDQVYFLAMAQVFCSKTTILDYGVSLFEDEHPPPFLRVNTIVDNSRKFPEIFECKLGVKMNPSADLKCETFPALTPVDDDRDSTPYE